MSSIITAVFEVTIGLLVSKGRDKAAERLQRGDVTDQKFRGVIVREIEDVKSKLDGLARKDLFASISFFEEGIELLCDVFENTRLTSAYDPETAQVATGPASSEIFSLTRAMRKLKFTGLNEATTSMLNDAKKRFERARERATEAFVNEALELSERVLAMRYRIMSTILETVDNPANALPACKLCVEDLHRVSGVKDCFTVELKKGLRARWGKKERRKLISDVCHINRTVYDVTLMVRFGFKNELSVNWPSVDIGEERVNPLRNERVTKILKKQSMEHCCVPWSFGQEGEVEHKLSNACGIATNTKGYFLIADNGDKSVKVFNRNGKFQLRFTPQTDDVQTKLQVYDVANEDVDDNIYLLVGLKKPGAEEWESEVQIFNTNGDLQHKFSVRKWHWAARLTVSGRKVLVLADDVIDVYEQGGEFVCTFGEERFKRAMDNTALNDAGVVVVDRDDSCVHLFTAEGRQIAKFLLSIDGDHYYRIACHPLGEYIVLAGHKRETRHLTVSVYTVKGEFVRKTQMNEELSWLGGITVTIEGHIALVFEETYSNCKVIVI